jgi:hypothetical protein
MSVCSSDEAGRKAGCSVFDVSRGHGAQTSNGALSVTDSAYNGVRPVESNHQEAETIGSSEEASHSAFDASGGHGKAHVGKRLKADFSTSRDRDETGTS